jgi:hypothetical protein
VVILLGFGDSFIHDWETFMYQTFFKLALTGIVAISLSACTTSGGSDSSSGGSVAATAKSSARQQLSQAEVKSLYSGKTARGSGHSTTYKANGTWVNNSGATGRWSVTSNGTLVMTGGLNLRLQVFREGSRYYHRNARTGAGGYYSVR